MYAARLIESKLKKLAELERNGIDRILRRIQKNILSLVRPQVNPVTGTSLQS